MPRGVAGLARPVGFAAEVNRRASRSIEPIFGAVCQDQGAEDDAANFVPLGLLIGHAFEGEFLYLRLRGPRDVSYPRGTLAPQITKDLCSTLAVLG